MYILFMTTNNSRQSFEDFRFRNVDNKEQRKNNIFLITSKGRYILKNELKKRSLHRESYIIINKFEESMFR